MGPAVLLLLNPRFNSPTPHLSILGGLPGTPWIRRGPWGGGVCVESVSVFSWQLKRICVLLALLMGGERLPEGSSARRVLEALDDLAFKADGTAGRHFGRGGGRTGAAGPSLRSGRPQR